MRIQMRRLKSMGSQFWLLPCVALMALNARAGVNEKNGKLYMDFVDFFMAASSPEGMDVGCRGPTTSGCGTRGSATRESPLFPGRDYGH